MDETFRLGCMSRERLVVSTLSPLEHITGSARVNCDESIDNVFMLTPHKNQKGAESQQGEMNTLTALSSGCLG